MQVLARWLFPLLIGWAMKVGAKAFKNKYDPRVHALKSRRWIWDHGVLPLREKTAATPNPLDDLGGDFAYWYHFGPIEDGSLLQKLESAKGYIEQGAGVEACKRIDEVLTSIRTP